MERNPLTVARLLQSGFQEIGCWELSETQELSHSIKLPKTAGVYAFALDGAVQYVGLASKSLHQRLNFYRKPGVSQRTNMRLNEIIRRLLENGTKVQILVSEPPDYEWNNLKISGPEGLEAGLISEFDLPWNVRGARPAEDHLSSSGQAVRRRSVTERILDLVQRKPGMTELEIAKTMFGASAVQQSVNEDCRLLVSLGLVERGGVGGRGDPFTYRPTKKLLHLAELGVGRGKGSR